MEMNDVFIGSQNMPLSAYISQYANKMSDTELGATARKSFEEYQQYIERNIPFWRSEGKALKKQRKVLKISRKELGAYIGVCDQTVANLEKGKPVRSRKMFIRAYKTAMELISMKRGQNENLND